VIRGAALCVLLIATILLAGCGVLATDEAPTDPIQVDAPPLVAVFPEVEALAPPSTRELSLGRAGVLARRSALLVTSCGDDPEGRGFALDSQTLVAHNDALSGAGPLSVSTANGRSTAVGSANAYRVGDLAVARVARTLPRKLTPGSRVASGASVVVVTERNGKLRFLPGVVVDGVSGDAYGVRAGVLRLTSPLIEGDVGPVLDASGRVVAVALAVDPRTTLGVAIPVSALRGNALARTLEALPACD